jgi:hypothetical protein
MLMSFLFKYCRVYNSTMLFILLSLEIGTDHSIKSLLQINKKMCVCVCVCVYILDFYENDMKNLISL